MITALDPMVLWIIFMTGVGVMLSTGVRVTWYQAAPILLAASIYLQNLKYLLSRQAKWHPSVPSIY